MTAAVCPVCGSTRSQSTSRCSVCGAKTAYAAAFASERAYEEWKRGTARKAADLLHGMQAACVGRNPLTLCSAGAAYISPQGKLSLIEEEPEAAVSMVQVKEISSSQENTAVLYEDGSVSVAGSNEYGQLKASEWKHMKHVYASAAGGGCIYGITQDGEVRSTFPQYGSGVQKWTGLDKMACGSYYAAGLRKDGTVLVEGLMVAPEIREAVRQWSGIRDVIVAGNCAAGLKADGTVVFAGSIDDPRRAVEQWTDIRSICCNESYYIYGLQEDGTVRIAGECHSKYSGMGRKDAASWQNILAISGNRSAVAGLRRDGSLLCAGDRTVCSSIRNAYSEQMQKRIAAELIRSAVRSAPKQA